MTDNIVRCGRCNGNKQIMCLGGLYKECNVCNGIGYTNIPATLAVLDIDQQINNHVPLVRNKPKGRPKKIPVMILNNNDHNINT